MITIQLNQGLELIDNEDLEKNDKPVVYMPLLIFSKYLEIKVQQKNSN